MKPFTFLLLCALPCILTTCASVADYNSHVAARQDSLSGYSKDSGYGGAFTHRVEYR